MSFLPDNHIYSYSQLSSVSECPYAFYCERIETDQDGVQKELQSNFFAEHGSLMHKVLELWAKEKISISEMPDEYKRIYTDYVKTPPPPYMSVYRQNAYDRGLEYFQTFDGFPELEIISAEQSFCIDLPLPDGTTRPFRGVVDLIAKLKETDEMVILDHKSKSMKEFKKNRDTMYRQQYLYSAWFKEEYGMFPDILMFNLFKEGQLDMQQFSENEYKQTIDWAADCIRQIENRDVIEWLEMKPEPDFFCNEICSVRKYCPNGTLRPEPKTRRKKE